ncbi:hypothetical protein EW146_g1640 [Bondarzewia mesenterica]|uniref:Uncharacterized protein n=1 Tax=Bondarzewia mesenterica TaxID=1095465 RepID=A0A4S4M384_9AGAM|nr:hypothetical protein EW146_g1640 [Bondarzewia mesenterica]
MARSWTSEKANSDVEKEPAAVSYVQEAGEIKAELVGPKALWSKISSWGVETRGIEPVPIEDRTHENYFSIFTFFWTMNFCLLSIVTGMAGTLSFGLSLRDCSLVILFFSLLCSVPPAYLSTLGPKTGLRQMIQSRYSFGLYGSVIPVILNMATVTGFVLIGAVVGGQTLSSVNGTLSVDVGIVIISILTLLLSICGYKVLHYYEAYAWIPIFISIIIAIGCGGKHLSQQVEQPPATASVVLSFGGLVAGFLIPYGTLASDYATYMRPDAPGRRIFWYTFAGFIVPTIPLLVLGAAIGGAVPNVPEWSAGYESNSAGGVLAAMLLPAKGFGKFIVVVLAFSTLGNMAASTYSVSLNFQMVLPILVRVPRALFSIIIIAVVIPVSIKAAKSFFNSLNNFLGVIAYWSAAFVSIVITEHLVFRKGDATTYSQAIYNKARELPSGIAALAAGAISFALIIPCMDQIWYVGPIAKTTGDIGFEVAYVLSALLPEDVEEEQAHFQNVITTFQQYAPYTLAGNNRRRKDLFTLSREDQLLLDKLGYKKKLEEVDMAILKNAEFLSQIVANPEIFGHDLDDEEEGEEGEGEEHHGRQISHGHGHDRSDRSHSHSHSHSHGHPSASGFHPSATSGSRKRYRPTDFDMDKLRSTLKQFVRDWSDEGKEEREVCYSPMKDALVQHFSDIPIEERYNFRVLVPGAGLGRLAYDVAKLVTIEGFSCQGNEFSHYMLLSSFFVLNRTDAVNQHTIYPYVHSFSNLPTRAAMLRPVTIPDVLPGDLPPESNFSLIAGDFEEIYGVHDEADASEPQSGQWDAILTCFFIDTAKNIVNYLRILHKILAPGGVWVNLGPLLWHFENNTTNDPSIELDLEEVKQLAREIGFEIKTERTIDTTYVHNRDAMLGYVYHAAFWTATKKV